MLDGKNYHPLKMMFEFTYSIVDLGTGIAKELPIAKLNTIYL